MYFGNTQTTGWRLVACAIFLALCSACFGPPNLPGEIDVLLPDQERMIAMPHSSSELLASGIWTGMRTPDDPNAESIDDEPGPYGGLLTGGFLERPEPDTVMFRIRFDDEGRMTRITDNAFYFPEIFGDVFVVDGAFHATRTPGLTIALDSFIAQSENRIGIALPAEVRFFGISLGTAVVYSWGAVENNRVDGIFGYKTDLVGLPEIVIGNGGDQYPFFAIKE